MQPSLADWGNKVRGHSRLGSEVADHLLGVADGFSCMSCYVYSGRDIIMQAMDAITVYMLGSNSILLNVTILVNKGKFAEMAIHEESGIILSFLVNNS